ncbi:transposase [Desulfonema ishimotonii]|uniref:Transposase n=1 Tax=Desulfonema ishimotonii TaxID=45657 RepID=A0A401FXB4_9BACT|nr:WYL domain-containing protein [Desulfonema ishimotonii]GBC61574.1 transposase [Desulfonema ishimotonii]
MYFSDYLRGQSLAGLYRKEREWSDLYVTDLDRFFRPRLNSAVLKTLISALRRREVVMADYRKKDLEAGEQSLRSISPNHLVFADNRYHIRAYCHVKQKHLDFVLSRTDSSEIRSEDWVSSKEDHEWNRSVELSFQPNPDLPESVRQAIVKNYESDEAEMRKITCRQAIAFYIKRKFLAKSDKYQKPLWVLVKKRGVASVLYRLNISNKIRYKT